ncbi:phospholipid-binding protein MlaC [Oceaniserpentilla sp. 4NH20-0058]|uniref:MlaC/ttg2D family ABC transporter substrate-binding protein n=1 Tax=Oceaniserpentilla sp. 4NH20-0058 TaxID=3127660 RepID=UPI00310B0E5A
MMFNRVYFALFCILTVNAWAEPSVQQAFELVDKKIHSLMAKIEQSKANTIFTDKQKIQLVDAELGEVVDFKRIARRVMAKHFRSATKEQKYAFLAVFKSSLLNTYAKGLWEFNNYKVNLLPLNPTNQTERNTQVSFEVVTSSGQIFPVAQSLFYNKKENKWMVQNVIINGINMGLLFRERFSRLVSQNNGNIGLAIEEWGASGLAQAQNATAERIEESE